MRRSAHRAATCERLRVRRGYHDGVAWITFQAEAGALLRSVPWTSDAETSARVELSVIATSVPVARVRVLAVSPDGSPLADEQDVRADGVVAFADAPGVRHLTVEGLDALGQVITTCDATMGQACGARRMGPARHGPSPATFDR